MGVGSSSFRMRESKYTEAILTEKVLLAKNMSDLVRILTGKEKVHGSMTKYIKDKLLKYNINFSHFEKGRGRNTSFTSNSYDYIEENYLCFPPKLKVGSHQLKLWLYKFNILEEKCIECGIQSLWNGKKLSLQLDHIDGDSLNNELNNLRILCPNCHSQTNTFSGKRNVRHKIIKEKIKVFKNKCQNCNKDTNRKKFCSQECYKQSSVLHIPTREELSKVIEEIGLNYSRISKIYKTSDNTIKKWCIKYNLK